MAHTHPKILCIPASQFNTHPHTHQATLMPHHEGKSKWIYVSAIDYSRDTMQSQSFHGSIFPLHYSRIALSLWIVAANVLFWWPNHPIFISLSDCKSTQSRRTLHNRQAIHSTNLHLDNVQQIFDILGIKRSECSSELTAFDKRERSTTRTTLMQRQFTSLLFLERNATNGEPEWGPSNNRAMPFDMRTVENNSPILQPKYQIQRTNSSAEQQR